jgi:hypothetical protein
MESVMPDEELIPSFEEFGVLNPLDNYSSLTTKVPVPKYGDRFPFPAPEDVTDIVVPVTQV